MDILPIGSIIDVFDTEFMIIGYELTMGERISGFYRVISLPEGYLGNESVGALPFTIPYTLRVEGYRDEQFEHFRKTYFRYLNGGEGSSLSEGAGLLNTIVDRILGGFAHEGK